MAEEALRKRNTAVKVNAHDILHSEYVKEEGWNANYLKVKGGNVSRVNLLGVITMKPENDRNSMVVDDGSGELHLRVFENKPELGSFMVGDCILIIGRPREYNGNKYVIPETVKKIDPRWMKVRKKELGDSPSPQPVPPQAAPQPTTPKETPVKVEAVKDVESPTDKVYLFIKDQDKGDGVDVDTIIESSKVEQAERIVNEFLKNGDVFEIKPGRVKVLE